MGDTSAVSLNLLTWLVYTNISKFDNFPMEFANPNNGNMDVLQDFDFDSFLHQDGEGVDNFNFDSFGGLDGNEIGAE
jgi:hypothetical protein